MHGDYEVRQYNDLVTAKVTVDGPFEAAYIKGSQLLMSYLNGNNYKKQRINHGSFFMLLSCLHGWEVSCILPEQFTLSNSPKPVGDAIEFEELSSRNVLVHKFSGKSAYASVMKKFEKLKNWAQESNLLVSKSERIVIYNNSILPFFRKNEIHVDSL
jgi:hypothetical protein